MNSKASIVFILGFPRSGTTLLRSLLCNHSEIYITYEMLFLPWVLQRWDSYGDLSEYRNFSRLYKDIMATYYFVEKSTAGRPILDQRTWYESCKEYSPLGILVPIIRFETDAPEGKNLILGDKSPNYTTHVPRIIRAIPEAKFIHIVRDVRDAALSARSAWKKNILRFAQRWSDGTRKLKMAIAELDESTVVEIRYEDLIREPERILRQLLGFLGLDFEDEILYLKKPSENLGDTKGEARIVAGNLDKYKKKMTSKEIARMNQIAGEMLTYYGYEVSKDAVSRRLGLAETVRYGICDFEVLCHGFEPVFRGAGWGNSLVGGTLNYAIIDRRDKYG
jgi:hypothetical protein